MSNVMSPIGDLNNDGINDIGMCDSRNNRLYIHFADSTGFPRNASADVVIGLGASDANRLVNIDTGNFMSALTSVAFCSSFAVLPDMNGDGQFDLAVGESCDTSTTQAVCSTVVIIFMKNDGSGHPINGRRIAGPAYMKSYGTQLTVVNGVTHPAYPTAAMLLSAFPLADPSAAGGLVASFISRTDGSLLHRYNITKESDTIFDSLVVAADKFGVSINNLGDIDGDGVDDLICAAPTASKAPASSYLVVMFLNATGGVRALGTKTTVLSQSPRNANTYFMSSMKNIGDVDGDGVPEEDVGCKRVYHRHLVVLCLEWSTWFSNCRFSSPSAESATFVHTVTSSTNGLSLPSGGGGRVAMYSVTATGVITASTAGPFWSGVSLYGQGATWPATALASNGT